MLLGRRKSGFTEEQVLRPSEIPDYVNEENDTTFARPKSACMGHEAPAAPEPQAWIPPQPMPEYRLLREYIRSQCELHQITPRSQLLGEDPGTGALLEQIAHDPECADITALEGQKDTYYCSSQVMSSFFAWVTMLVMEDDLPRTIAEMTRHNCTTYPAPTLLEYFTLSPFRYGQERIDQALSQMRADPRYQDIRLFESPGGRMYLYSSDKMSEKYARALSVDMDRGPVD